MTTEEGPPARRWRRWPAEAMRWVLAAILILAMADMLAGVVLRYVVVRITDYFDLPGISFFWVEEVGEFALCWLTFIGAAVAILERTHFALVVLTHRLPPPLQRPLERVNYLLIAGFGGVTAFYGWKVSALNAMLVSPALSINLGFLFFAAVGGGGLIALYGLAVACGVVRPRDLELPVGPE
ncbi:MAG TPA: TRAP transporter small permease [Stellaceae bacterium]|nr:TRAP transporter small permease [Stellaceae bacterium]